MSIWPYLSVFISLVLILFFRRIDKRIINFNKFKRYADKLSSDFSAFLNVKKEELSKGVSDLDNTLKKAVQTLEKLDLAEQRLEADYTGILSEKPQIEGIKKELENLKGLKEDITKEIVDIGKNLPSFKKLSRRIQKIGLKVLENEKVLKNFSSSLYSMEKQVHEKADKAIEEVTQEVLKEAKVMFHPLIDEYRDNLELLRSSQKEELERFKRETEHILKDADKGIQELLDSIENCHERVTVIERSNLKTIDLKIEEVNKSLITTGDRINNLEKDMTEDFMKKAEENYKSYLLLLENSENSYKNDIFQKIEERSKDLTSIVMQLEGRVQDLLKNIKNETDRYADVLNLKAKSYEGEIEVLKNQILTEINEEASRNLLLIKPIVSEMNDKLTSYKKDFASILEDVRSELVSQRKNIDREVLKFKEGIESYRGVMIDQLNARVQGMGDKLLQVESRIEEAIDRSSNSIGKAYINRLKEYEERIGLLEGRIGDLKNIARAGQKMIEERIESVFSNYKPEIDGKILSLQRETEQIYLREKEKTMQRIDSLLKDADAQLERREREIREFLVAVDENIKKSREVLQNQEDKLLVEVNEVKLSAREEVVRELESLKTLFKEEKERVIARYDQDLLTLNNKLDGINGKVEGLHEIINKKMEDAFRGVEKSVSEFEKGYLESEDERLKKLKDSLDNISLEIKELKGRVENLKDDVFKELEVAFSQLKVDYESRFEEHKGSLSGKEREILELVGRITEVTKSEMEKTQGEAGEVLKVFEKEMEAVRLRMEKKVGEIEKRISDFEKESSIMKKATKFKERLEEDLQKFSELIIQLREDKNDLMSLKKLIQNLKREEGDISLRVRQLKGDKRLVQNIAKNAEQAIGLISVVDEKIKLIETEKDVLSRVEGGIRDIQNSFKELEGKAGSLREREKEIEESIETVTKMKDFIANLEKRTEILREGFEEIKGMEGDIKNRVSSLDQKTSKFMDNEKRINDVASRFKDMDSLVVDIEARTKQLQSTREWLAKTESRLTNLTQDAERLLNDLKDYTEKLGTVPSSQGRSLKEKPGVLSREADSKVKTVLTLFEQKWTIPEICKVTKMSRGEVELILELNK